MSRKVGQSLGTGAQQAWVREKRYFGQLPPMGGRSPLSIATEAMISVRASGHGMLCSMSSQVTREKENTSHCLLIASSHATSGAIQR